MLNISENVKARFKQDSVPKKLTITMPNLGITVSDDEIQSESFELKESVMGASLDFTGCISSTMKVKIHNDVLQSFKSLQNSPIRADIQVMMSDKTWSDKIPLFTGYVDKNEKDDDKRWQTLTCYDALYLYGQQKVYAWYKSRHFSITLDSFRHQFFGFCTPIKCVETSLPNDEVKIKKRYKNKDMTAIEVMKGLCQINGCFGRINREGLFQFTYISGVEPKVELAAFPDLFYPNQLYPNQLSSASASAMALTESEGGAEVAPYYRSLTYQDYVVNPIAKGINMINNTDYKCVTVYDDRYATDEWEDDTTDDALIDDGDDVTNGSYILEGDFFSYKLKKNNKQKAISNMYKRMGADTYFREYKAVCMGLPYVECGDKLVFNKSDGKSIEFVVTSRTLKGVQAMTDTFECHVDNTVSEFIVGKAGSASKSSVQGVSEDDVKDMASSTVNDALTNVTGKEVMVVVSWDASTGVLETTSAVINAQS